MDIKNLKKDYCFYCNNEIKFNWALGKFENFKSYEIKENTVSIHLTSKDKGQVTVTFNNCGIINIIEIDVK